MLKKPKQVCALLSDIPHEAPTPGKEPINYKIKLFLFKAIIFKAFFGKNNFIRSE